ncbi:MAG: hypothetical protein OXC40_04425 [Proteobacteria bacterium]|nr:hypothetical protein [Pseudomonadota bacterium]
MENPVKVIFDLDSTLFNTCFRTKSIFEEFARDPEFSKKYPLLVTRIHSWQNLHEIYDPIEFVSYHSGIAIDPYSQLAFDLRTYWRIRFFHGAYLSYDQLYSGSFQVMKQLETTGCDITYLTARNRRDLLGGTLLSLIQHDLPVPKVGGLGIKKHDQPNVSLIMKQCSRSDENYKDHQLAQLKRGYQKIFYIENEPGIVMMARERHPEIATFLFNSVHSGQVSSYRELLGSCQDDSPLSFDCWQML